MSEAPKRIWADGKPVCGSWSVAKDFDDDVEYIRADLVEAAIKRALEGVVDVLEDEGWLGDSMLRIRAMDPAQFIEEPKG
jgi:hypothetical protein